MCIEVRKKCHCGQHSVQFHMRDNIMSAEVVAGLSCPSCSPGMTLDRATMLEDNGWIIEYDMDLARMFAITKLAIKTESLSPAFLFDSGYACWREMYPGESEDIAGEREMIIAGKEEDPRGYLTAINSWAINRINRLKKEGWRKAQLA